MANLSNRMPLRVQSFNGGQYSANESSFIPQHSAKELRNIVIDQIGNATQREGLYHMGEVPATLTYHVPFNDSSSADVIGALDGTDTAITYATGKFGMGASFNGTTSNIVVAADTAIDVNTLGSMTISAWVYADTDGEGNVGRIVDKFSGTDVGYRLWLSGSDTVPVINFEVGYVTTNAIVTTTTTVTAGAWTKIDAVLEADHSINIYINGAVASYGVDTTGVGGVNDDSAVDMIIGNNSTSAYTFDGMLDNIKIFSEPRSSANVQQSKVYGLHRFYVSGTVDYIYRIVGTTLQRLNGDLKDYTDIETGLTTSKDTRMFTARADDGTYRMVICNGADNVHSMTTGEAITDEGTGADDPPTDSPWGEWHDNRAFFIDANGDIRFSNILDFQTCTSTDIFRAKKPAVCLKSFKEKQLIIYNESGIEILNTSGSTPLSDWAKTVLSDGIQFNSPKTVVNTGDDQIFLAKDGVRILSRTEFDKIQAGVVSGPVRDVIETINIDQIHKACAWLINNKYVLAIPTGTATENNTVLIWNLLAAKAMGQIDAGWSVIPADTWYPSHFADYEFSDQAVSLVMGDNRALSNTYRAFNGDHDNGAAVVSEIISVEHTIDRVTDVIWDPVHVVALSGSDSTYSVELSINNTGFIEVKELDLDGGAPVLPIALPFDLSGTARISSLFRTKHLGRGTICQVKIKHNTYNQRPTFIEYTLYARKLQPRFR